MNETYLDTKIKKTCNGCGVCALVCPKKCIKMIEDEEGFLYPEIDKMECINCGKCRKMCSNFPQKNEYQAKVYAAKNIDENQRKNSTSGGMFKILVDYVIEQKGVIFGAEMDETFQVFHSFSDDIKECQKYSNSKYVRSNLKSTYSQVKEFLNQNRIVLFSGTPCQVYGLKIFVGKEYENLILCEIVCHANPSPKVLNMFIKNHEINAKKSVKEIYFRNKNKENGNGNYIEFDDGEKRDIKTYIRAFSEEHLINRPSCSECKFVSKNRKADFTIGDFWGIDKFFMDFDDKKGISLLMINTDKADRIFSKISKKIECREVDIEKAFMYNHNCNVPQSKHREKFFEGISNGFINENNIIKIMEKYTKKTIFIRAKWFFKRILKKF